MFSALAVASGWILSAFGELNRVGYLGVLLLLTVVTVVYLRRHSPPSLRSLFPLRRFRRLFPLGFIIIAVFCFIGGLLYAPANFDGLCYRTPRALHWIFAQQWHWIHSPDGRMNTRACGFEWITVPLILFTGSDRLFFLINWFSFLLLPGVLFSFLRAFYVPGRVAWSWAWIFPTGYCFVVQAGSIANDSWAAVYILAALTFAQRFKTTRAFSDFAWSLLAIALTTGAKAINLALLLPWVIAILPSLSFLFLLHWKKLLLLLPPALLVSFLPTALLNQIYCGDWTGMALEPYRFTLKSPLEGIAGNTLLLLWYNLRPPFFPWSSAFVQWYPQSGLYQSLGWMNQSFETHYWVYVNVLPAEEWAGTGLGVTGLILVSLLAALFQKAPSAPPRSWGRRALLYSPCVSFLAVMDKSSLALIARLIAPYYAALLPVLLAHPAQSRIVRARWWQRLCFCVWIVALGVVILPPVRHLWPAETLFRYLQARHPSSPTWRQAVIDYDAGGNRSDWLAPVRADLPSDIHRFGLIDNANECETSLWRPFGSRSFYHLTSDDTPATLRREKITCVVIFQESLPDNMTLDAWLASYHGAILSRHTIEVPQNHETTHWLIVKIEP